MQIAKTKKAAESAKSAAILAQKGVRRLDSLVEIASVSKAMDEIKEAIRLDTFEKLPPLFDKARKSLITARENHPNLKDSDRAAIQKSLTFFTKTEIDLAENGTQSLIQKKAKLTSAMIEISDANYSLLTNSRLAENSND